MYVNKQVRSACRALPTRTHLYLFRVNRITSFSNTIVLVFMGLQQKRYIPGCFNRIMTNITIFLSKQLDIQQQFLTYYLYGLTSKCHATGKHVQEIKVEYVNYSKLQKQTVHTIEYGVYFAQ